MRTIFKLALAAAAIAVAPNAASAAVVLTYAQVGANVVATSTGTLSLTGLSNLGGFTLDVGVRGNTGYAAIGTPAGASVTGYSGFTGPTTFGTGVTLTTASSSTGSLFAINASGGRVFVAPSFVSGGSIAGTATFANTTLAALGLTNGTYSFRSSGDTLTVNIGATTPGVPEPATWAMMMLGFGAMGFAMRRGKTTSARIRFA